MPRLSIDLSPAQSDQLIIYMKENGIKTKAGAIRIALNSALNQRGFGADLARFPHARARLAPLDKENILTERSMEPLEGDFSLSVEKNSRKSAPPGKHPLPDSWTPPEGFRADWVARYGLNYATALDLFRSLAKSEARKSGSWDNTWRAQVVKGQLRHLRPVGSEDDIRPEDTQGFWLNYKKDD
jgi:hypothetical protein